MSSPEGTERCCICAKRQPIACGVCIGVSCVDVDVTWYVRRMNELHAQIAQLRDELAIERAKRDAMTDDEGDYISTLCAIARALGHDPNAEQLHPFSTLVDDVTALRERAEKVEG